MGAKKDFTFSEKPKCKQGVERDPGNKVGGKVE
jgi:hypothetical protein